VSELMRLAEWAREQSALHHRFAVDDEHLRTEHIARSSAYRELAKEIELRARSDQPELSR
jgi:hypothetical protein